MRLKDGKWVLENEYGQRESVFLTDFLARGDLDGDGAEDAVLILVSSGGGSGFFYELAFVINHLGNPVHQSSVLLGDRVKIKSLSLHEGVATVDMITQSESDGACCPTLDVIERYRLVDGVPMQIRDGA